MTLISDEDDYEWEFLVPSPMLFRKLLFILLIAFGCTTKNRRCFKDGTLAEESKRLQGSWISVSYVDTLTRYKSWVWANNSQSRFPELIFNFQSPLRDTLINWWNYSPVLSEIRSNVIATCVNDTLQWRWFDSRLSSQEQWWLHRLNDRVLMLGDFRQEFSYLQISDSVCYRDKYVMSPKEIAINQLLLEGQWVDQSDTLVLTESGGITGWKNWEFYYTNSEETDTNEPDVITVNNSYEAKSYVVTFENETMNWYDYFPPDQFGSWTRGPLVHSLRKLVTRQ